jgi:hypothetical protein
MRNDSYKTVINRISEYIDDWRKATGMSQITVVDEIVKAHERIDGPAATGIHFEKSTDEWNRQKNNADRVWRWLDDKSKDRNLLPVNFLPSILAAMPEETRRAFLTEMLAPLGLKVSAIDHADDGNFDFDHVCDTHVVAVNTVQLLNVALKDPTEENLLKAELAVQKAAEKWGRTRKLLAGARAKCSGLFKKFRKEKVTP